MILLNATKATPVRDKIIARAADHTDRDRWGVVHFWTRPASGL